MLFILHTGFSRRLPYPSSALPLQICKTFLDAKKSASSTAESRRIHGKSLPAVPSRIRTAHVHLFSAAETKAPPELFSFLFSVKNRLLAHLSTLFSYFISTMSPASPGGEKRRRSRPLRSGSYRPNPTSYLWGLCLVYHEDTQRLQKCVGAPAPGAASQRQHFLENPSGFL